MSGSNPGFVLGQVPTPTEWNDYFSGKVDETQLDGQAAQVMAAPAGQAGQAAMIALVGVHLQTAIDGSTLILDSAGAVAVNPAVVSPVPSAGIVYSTGTAFSNVTVGTGLSLSGQTLTATGVINYPAAGIVYSTGTSFSDVTIGTGLSLTGTTLAATGTATNVSSYAIATPANGGTVAIATYGGLFYTQQINPTNTVTSLAITLPSSPPDGQRLTIASNSSMSGMVITPNSSQTLGPNIPTAIKAGNGFTLQIQAGVWERVQ